MTFFRCMDCSAVIPWYDAFILGRSRCPACHEATLAWEALEAGSRVADEVSQEQEQETELDQQVTVPLEVRQVIEDVSRRLLSPPPPPPVVGVKLQPVVLELTSGRLECGRCGALAMLVRLWHGETCDDPEQFAFQALCQACWGKERTA